MQFRLSNGFSLFVPLVVPSEYTLETWPWFRILYVTELISTLVALPGVILLIHVLGKSVQLFHKNLIRVAQVPYLSRSSTSRKLKGTW